MLTVFRNMLSVLALWWLDDVFPAEYEFDGVRVVFSKTADYRIPIEEERYSWS